MQPAWLDDVERKKVEVPPHDTIFGRRGKHVARRVCIRTLSRDAANLKNYYLEMKVSWTFHIKGHVPERALKNSRLLLRGFHASKSP